MLVLDYFKQASLYGVGLYLVDHFGLLASAVAKQLIKAIDILVTKTVPSNGYVKIHLIEPDDAPSYYAVTGVYEDGEYCIALVPWGEWLTMPVHVYGPALTVDEITALILYEMTPSGDPRGAKS